MSGFGRRPEVGAELVFSITSQVPKQTIADATITQPGKPEEHETRLMRRRAARIA